MSKEVVKLSGLDEFIKFLIENKEDLIFTFNRRPIRRMVGIAYTSSSDPEFMVPHVIDEGCRYKLDKKYKVRLRCIFEKDF